jgi:hypothetical protein
VERDDGRRKAAPEEITGIELVVRTRSGAMRTAG